MTAFELHLEIDQKLQEQGSFMRDRIFPEAKDLALNEAQLEILKNYTEFRLGDREAKLKAIEPLLVKNLTLPLATPTTSDSYYEPNAKFITFPPDFFYGVNYRAEVVVNTLNCDSRPTIPTTAQTTYIYKIYFPVTNLTTGPYYNGFKIDKTGSPVNLYTLPTALTNRIYSTDEKYIIVDNILDQLNTPGAITSAYWEYYNGTRYANTIIITSTVSLGTVVATIYQENGSTIDATSIATITSNSLNLANRAVIDSTEGVIKTFPALKLVEPAAVYKAQLNKFTRSKPTEPQGARSSTFFWVYEGQSFIVTAVGLDYIRKPRKISLVLSQTSELDPSVHAEIVDRAVEILKMNIQDPSVQGSFQYNQETTRQ